ncbi:MAG TPA: hypothetical protein VLC07_07210, partial [Solirubrobacterales bacterium]|nr:hypothetical protein [Solirubrobacterales bacterium]
LLASNAEGTTPGPDAWLHTYALPNEGPDTCPNAALRAEQHASFLPECRAYEMVSPPDKGGGNVIADTGRVRAAADGSAVQFSSLAAFGDAVGTGVAVDYESVRSQPGAVDPGNGWSTHAITPPQSGGTLRSFPGAGEDSRYDGEFSTDLQRGVVFAQSPVTEDPETAEVTNLYLRTDLRSPGAGSYQEITRCPLCEETGTPLPAPTSAETALATNPAFAWMSPDSAHIAFESGQPLTADTPPFPGRVEAYEWDQGTVRLVGRIPGGTATSCNDETGPACKASTFSVLGRGTGAAQVALTRAPDSVSDGSDGHTRIFFTRPTKPDGTTLDPTSLGGRLYMRVDGTETVQLNASERTKEDTRAPAFYEDASRDGTRVFFQTTQALTDGAPLADSKFYMYDASKPPSAPDNLTLLSGDLAADTFIGASEDGSYAYFTAGNELYAWHDGALAHIGPEPFRVPVSDYATWSGPRQTQTRITPDGRFFLFNTKSGEGLGGYDQTGCPGACNELYLYSAETGKVACVSCNPTGAPATASAFDAVRTLNGGALFTFHRNHPLTDDGSKVFFSSGEALVPEDTNGKSDAYEYDVATGKVQLISSGTSPDDSYFMEASADGSDVFFLTTQKLVGWDRDQAYDLYDARVGGGFPEPVAVAAPCEGETCRGAAPQPPPPPATGSTLAGPGNPAPGRPICPKGRKAKKVRGKTRCVKPHKHRHHRKPTHHHREGAK